VASFILKLKISDEDGHPADVVAATYNRATSVFGLTGSVELARPTKVCALHPFSVTKRKCFAGKQECFARSGHWKEEIVGRVPPRLAVARAQITQIINTGDTAVGFNSHDTLFAKALPKPGTDDRFSVCFLDRPIRFNLLLELAFRGIRIVTCHDSSIFQDGASVGRSG
jgi:hypothetical protein